MGTRSGEKFEPGKDARASLFALVVLIPWMIVLGYALNDWYKDVKLGERAVWTSGVVTKIETNNHQRYDYEYSVDGISYSGGEIIAGASLGVGQQVQVSYLPGAPQTSSLTRFGAIGTRPVPILFCTFIAVVAYLRLRKFLRIPRNSYDR